MKTVKLFLIVVCAMIISTNTMQAAEKWLEGYKKVLVIGAHPDDPECMCGGTMLKLKEMGVEVVVVYMTGGEAGIAGKTYEEARAIRRVEARNSCEKMGLRHIFLSQIDANSVVNKARYAEMKALIEKEQPDMVITHWPIDSHRDHRICALLVYDAWRYTDHSFDLYYAEVMTGVQTQNFTPTLWVDITDTRDQKIEAYLCHKSQGLDKSVLVHHSTLERMRGMQCQAEYAEAFVKMLWAEEE